MKARMKISVSGSYNLAAKAEITSEDVPSDVIAQWCACGHAEPLDKAAKDAAAKYSKAEVKAKEDAEEAARAAKLAELEKELNGSEGEGEKDK